MISREKRADSHGISDTRVLESSNTGESHEYSKFFEDNRIPESVEEIGKWFLYEVETSSGTFGFITQKDFSILSLLALSGKPFKYNFPLMEGQMDKEPRATFKKSTVTESVQFSNADELYVYLGTKYQLWEKKGKEEHLKNSHRAQQEWRRRRREKNRENKTKDTAHQLPL